MNEEYRLYGQAKSRWFPTSAVQLLEDEFGASVCDCGEQLEVLTMALCMFPGEAEIKMSLCILT